MITFQKKKVLVPTDFSPQADQVVLSALDMADAPDDVSVIHVAPPMSSYPVADPAIVWESITEEARAKQITESYHHHIQDPRAEKAHFQVSFGTPAEEITQYAQKHEIDLIMMPSHGHGGLRRLLIGSVTDRVVHAAHCAVLVIRE